MLTCSSSFCPRFENVMLSCWSSASHAAGCLTLGPEGACQQQAHVTCF